MPDLNQLLKDHKPTLQTRPVARAKVTQAPNGPMAEVLCEILNPFVEEADKERRTEVKSTEEMCAVIKATNDNISRDGLKRGAYQRAGSLIVGSKDVKAHYPEIDIEVAAEELKKEIEESNLEVNVDEEELALYIACSMKPEEIEKEGLTEVVHKRRFKNGARPGLTCKAITGGPATRNEDKSWLPPTRRPNRSQKMRMVGCLVKSACRLVMSNHFYSFDNKIRRQHKGGAIGNKLTERLGKVLMKRHAKKYLRLLEVLDIKKEMLTGYVDDTTDVLVAIDPGVRLVDGKLEVKEELVDEDKMVPEDERTMKLLKEVANTVYECVQFTVDFPSAHPEKKVPVLDLKVHCKEGQIIHEFYEKPCASKLVIPFTSAHSRKMKMAVMVEEGIRRLRNHSRGLEWEASRRVMELWSRKLRRSGYPMTVRHQVIKTACEKWDKMCEDEDNGVRPVHRPREWKERERRLEKEAKVGNWHQAHRNQVSAPLILDPVAGVMVGEMKEVCKRFESLTGMRVVVQTRAGKANKQLAKSEPLRSKKCGREECLVCATRGGSCEKNGAGYQIRCETCLRSGRTSTYDGETGRNCFCRGKEHQDALRLEDQENPLWKHCVLEHGGIKADFSMKVIGRFQSCLVRQVNEAVRIGMSDADCVMNSKAEFHQAPIVRVRVEQGLVEEQGEVAGQDGGAGHRGGRGRGGRQRGRGEANTVNTVGGRGGRRRGRGS